MHALNDDTRSLAKPALYEELESSLRGLLAGEPNLIACAANMSSLLYWSLPDLNWVGFYLVDAKSGDLLVGPVEGRHVVLVDDLIGAGTTMLRAVQACRMPGPFQCGAAERVAAVPGGQRDDARPEYDDGPGRRRRGREWRISAFEAGNQGATHIRGGERVERQDPDPGQQAAGAGVPAEGQKANCDKQ